ncbi:MAG: hypothetical protein IJQ39_08245 [Thermoguttaceae bacterium]|nr:hypothetical protein [Thermoguttaceae bacterium]
MRKHICFIFAILLSSSFALTTPAQDFVGENEDNAVESGASIEPDVSRPKIFSAEKCLGKGKKGATFKQYLMIEYPWSKITNATLEVRIIGPEAEKQPQFCRPVFFKAIYGKLERIDQDISNKKIGNQRFANDIEYPKSLFHEYGLPEPESIFLSTIKPPAGARADYFYMVLINPDINERETTLVFHDLEQWAVDSGRLAIELHGKKVSDNMNDKSDKYVEFEKPCTIKIWLLSDDVVVWEETFKWSGVKNNTSAKASDKKTASEFDDDEDPRQSAKKMEEANKAQKKNEQQPEETEDEDFEGFGDEF